MSLSETQNSLMNLIGFTDEDLEANREGYMHKQQRLMLSHKRRGWSVRILVALGLGIILCIAIVLTDVYGTNFSAKVAPLTTIFILVSVFIINGWFRRNQFDSDLKKGTIYSVEGEPSLTSYSRAFSYTVKIHGEWFGVTKKIFSAFKNLEPSIIYCRIYYVPKSRTILSVEFLGGLKH